MSIVLAVILFSILILFHELGHFSVAKLNGIRVNEFSLGLGPTLFGFTVGETKYSLKLLPFGGACMMEGEDESSDDDRAFNKKNVWARISVVAAGPIFNFVLALVFSTILIGATGIDRAKVLQVEEGSPAYEAGLKEGDIITKYDGKTIHFGREIYLKDMLSPITGDKSITIVYKRDGQKYSATVTPVEKQRYLVGFSYSVSQDKAIIEAISPDGALAETDAKAGDAIVGINGTNIDSSAALEEYFNEHPMTADSVTLTLERVEDDKTKTLDVTVTPKPSTYYETGLAYNYYQTEKVGFFETIYFAFCELGYYVDTTIQSLKMLLTGGASVNDMSSVLGITQSMGSSFDQAMEVSGIKAAIGTMLTWLIMLSANLGVMNLLPIPALDGGRLIFLFIEAIRRKPIDPNKEGIVHMIGIILLFALMFLVMANDVRKMFMP